MPKDTRKGEPVQAEDFFIDNTQDHKEKKYVHQAGATLGTLRAQVKRSRFKKRNSSLGQDIVQSFVKKISEAELNVRLDQLNIPRPDDPINMSPVIRDSAFSLVSEFLRQFGQGEWVLRPRTFCILRVLGCPEAMETFIAMKRTDPFLPYDDRNLPDVIKGTDIRVRFFQLQNMVLSSQYLDELEEEGRAPCNFSMSVDDYFPRHRSLGCGGFGTVDAVWGKFTLKHLARKQIHRGIWALQD